MFGGLYRSYHEARPGWWRALSLKPWAWTSGGLRRVLRRLAHWPDPEAPRAAWEGPGPLGGKVARWLTLVCRTRG